MYFSFFIFLPLLMFIFLSLFSFLFKRRSLLVFICFMTILLFFFSCTNFFYFFTDIQLQIEYGYWYSLNSFQLHWELYCNRFIAIMLLIISSISSIVIFYSIDYMFFDPNLLKFLSYLFLFIFFMFLLVSNNNFLQLFLGWEGVGLCSFLLINFWYTRTNATRSSLKALLINRIGDLFLLFGFSFIFFFFRTLNFSILSVLVSYINNFFFFFYGYPIFLTSIISFFLLVGAIGKSAQLGLHSWLPDAMEGPTPVSALIHAATMVTAGVFLVLRCSFFFEYSSFFLFFLFFWGGLTALVASTIGLVQNDIKKIIAYSTCSQLGLMFLVCGLSFYQIALFHLILHAFFKALLFLIAGAIIHQCSDEQDMRRLGNLIFFFPFLFICCGVGSFSLMGFPFLSGFYSKDLIIEGVFNYRYNFSFFFFFFIALITVFSSLYSVRLILKSFFFSTNLYYGFLLGIHGSSFFIFSSLVFLSIFSIISGYFFSNFFSVVGNSFFSNNFFFVNNLNIEFEFFLPHYLKIIPIFFSFCGGLVSWLFFQKPIKISLFCVFLWFKHFIIFVYSSVSYFFYLLYWVEKMKFHFFVYRILGFHMNELVALRTIYTYRVLREILRDIVILFGLVWAFEVFVRRILTELFYWYVVIYYFKFSFWVRRIRRIFLMISRMLLIVWLFFRNTKRFIRFEGYHYILVAGTRFNKGMDFMSMIGAISIFCEGVVLILASKLRMALFVLNFWNSLFDLLWGIVTWVEIVFNVFYTVIWPVIWPYIDSFDDVLDKFFFFLEIHIRIFIKRMKLWLNLKKKNCKAYFFYVISFIKSEILIFKKMVHASWKVALGTQGGIFRKVKVFLYHFYKMDKIKLIFSKAKLEKGFLAKIRCGFKLLKEDPDVIRPFIYFCIFKAIKGFIFLFCGTKIKLWWIRLLAWWQKWWE